MFKFKKQFFPLLSVNDEIRDLESGNKIEKTKFVSFPK